VLQALEGVARKRRELVEARVRSWGQLWLGAWTPKRALKSWSPLGLKINGFGRCSLQAQGQRQELLRCSPPFSCTTGGDLKGKGAAAGRSPKSWQGWPPVPASEKA